MATPEEPITVPEAAARFGVAPQTIRNWIASGEIHAWRPGIGRGLLVDAKEITRLRRLRPTGEHEIPPDL